MSRAAVVVGREMAAARHQQVVEVGQRRVGDGASRPHVRVGAEPRRLAQVHPAEGHDHDADDEDEGHGAAWRSAAAGVRRRQVDVRLRGL